MKSARSGELATLSYTTLGDTTSMADANAAEGLGFGGAVSNFVREAGLAHQTVNLPL